MDLNYLLHRHQISLMRAARAACSASRIAHEGLGLLYAEAVARHQQRSGGTLALLPYPRLLPSRG